MIEANCKKIAPSTMATPRPVPKLVVCDLDGTLLRAENGIRLYSDHISPRTVAAIEAFERRGGHFLPATGNGWAVTSDKPNLLASEIDAEVDVLQQT